MSTISRVSQEFDKIDYTLIDVLQQRAKRQSNTQAYIFLENGNIESETLTYQQLDLEARSIAAQLQSTINPGERALLLYSPGLKFVTAFFACLYAGIIPIPACLPSRRNFIKLKAIVVDAKPRVILTAKSELTKIQSLQAENLEFALTQLICTDSIDANWISKWQKPLINKNTLALLQYTSGSTGTPKGVMITHGNLMCNSGLIQKYFEHTPDSRGVMWLPTYHDMGLLGGVIQPVYVGFPVILMSPISFLQRPFRWLQAISHYKATTSGGPNFAYDLAYSKITSEQKASLDLSSWDLAFTGAEAVKAHTLKRFTSAFEPCGFRKKAFYPCYGMAEATLMVSGGIKSLPPVVNLFDKKALEQSRLAKLSKSREEKGNKELVSNGRNLSEQKIVIVNPETLHQCQDDEVGEIWVLGSSIAQGYWNKQDKTEETFHAYVANTGEGPFLRTGDIGFFKKDELFIAGRLKDLIIIRGKNYYPQDIESTVEKSHQALCPSCGAAFTVEINGSEKLVVIQEVERSYLKNLNVEEVLDSIQQSVVVHHGLHIFATILIKPASIPKTTSGKVQRYLCRSLFLSKNLNIVEQMKFSRLVRKLNS
jgi:acyl-CoA synthetase (AMP-forming)/AMP-acid ligase II